MNCLITGGCGFLGLHLVEELIRQKHKVVIFDKFRSKNLPKKINKFYKGDIKNIKSLEKSFKNIDLVFHFAALSDLNKAMNKPHDSVNYNILGTVNTLELCKKFKVKRFIFASSIYVNSKQGGFYRSSKRAAEDYIEEYNKRYKLNFTILRFGSLYGERSDINNGVRKILESGKYSNTIKYYGNPKSVRKYIYVKDAARACIEVIKNKYKNKHLIITGNKTISIKKLLKMVNLLFNLKKKIEFYPKKAVGHYIKNPYTYEFKKGINYITKNQIEFDEGLKKVFLDLNKKNL